MIGASGSFPGAELSFANGRKTVWHARSDSSDCKPACRRHPRLSESISAVADRIFDLWLLISHFFGNFSSQIPENLTNEASVRSHPPALAPLFSFTKESTLCYTLSTEGPREQLG